MNAADLHQRLNEHAPRTWQRMLSGRRLNLLTPSPVDIEIEDIALGLARNTRWNGQTTGAHAWSVAQHSVFVVEILRQECPRLTGKKRPPASLLMTALLHDASEYVTHDLITPLKAVVGDVFKEVEDRLMCAVYSRFGLPARPDPVVKAQIKQADLIAGATEAVQLAGFSVEEVSSLLSIREKPLAGVRLEPVPSAEAERLFLACYEQISRALTLEQR